MGLLQNSFLQQPPFCAPGEHTFSRVKGKRPIITRPEQVAAGSHLWDPAVRLFPYMLPVPYHWMPGHQSLQLSMRRGFAHVSAGQEAPF